MLNVRIVNKKHPFVDTWILGYADGAAEAGSNPGVWARSDSDSEVPRGPGVDSLTLPRRTWEG